MDDKATPGDEVKFRFPDGRLLIGRLLHVPVATGDAWRIQCMMLGKPTVIYVQQYETMEVVNDG